MSNITLLLIVLAFLAYQIVQRKTLPATSRYEKKRHGDWTTFDVSPGRPTVRAALMLPLGFGGLFLLFMPRPFTVMNYVGFFVLIFLLWYSFRDVRPKSHQRASQFRVSPQAIESGGRQFVAGDIHRVICQNAVDTDYVIVATNRRSAVQQAAQANDSVRAAKVAYSLNVEEGGRSHELAGGMNETTANGLLTDVARVIGFADST